MLYKILLIIIYNFIIITLLGCGYHLNKNTIKQASNQTKNINFYSYEPYGLLSRAIFTELRLNNINIVNHTTLKYFNIPVLHIKKILEHEQINTLLYQDKLIEYQITLILDAQLFIPKTKYYPITITLSRSFFTNSRKILTMDNTKNIILQEMFQQLAQQLVNKLLILVYY